jgi:hypothetical protein
MPSCWDCLAALSRIHYPYRMKFASIKNDIAFRKIFGNEEKTFILISFINAVLQLEGEQQIVAISFEDPFSSPGF